MFTVWEAHWTELTWRSWGWAPAACIASWLAPIRFLHKAQVCNGQALSRWCKWWFWSGWKLNCPGSPHSGSGWLLWLVHSSFYKRCCPVCHVVLGGPSFPWFLLLFIPHARPAPTELHLEPVLFLCWRDGPGGCSLVGLECSSEGTWQDNADAGSCWGMTPCRDRKILLNKSVAFFPSSWAPLTTLILVLNQKLHFYKSNLCLSHWAGRIPADLTACR